MNTEQSNVLYAPHCRPCMRIRRALSHTFGWLLTVWQHVPAGRGYTGWFPGGRCVHWAYALKASYCILVGRWYSGAQRYPDDVEMAFRNHWVGYGYHPDCNNYMQWEALSVGRGWRPSTWWVMAYSDANC